MIVLIRKLKKNIR